MSLAVYLPEGDVDAKDGTRPALKLVNWQVPSQSVNIVENASNDTVSEVIKIDFADANFWSPIMERVSVRDVPDDGPTRRRRRTIPHECRLSRNANEFELSPRAGRYPPHCHAAW